MEHPKFLQGKIDDSSEGDSSEASYSETVGQISRGIEWVKHHPVLAAVVWMFGESDSKDYYNELVEQAKLYESEARHGWREDEEVQSRDRLATKSLSWSDYHGQELAVSFDELAYKSASAPQLLYCKGSNCLNFPKSALKRKDAIRNPEQELKQSLSTDDVVPNDVETSLLRKTNKTESELYSLECSPSS